VLERAHVARHIQRAEHLAGGPSDFSRATACVCGGNSSWVAYPVAASGVIEAVVVQRQTARVEAITGRHSPMADRPNSTSQYRRSSG
jgi:hypothetical protein